MEQNGVFHFPENGSETAAIKAVLDFAADSKESHFYEYLPKSAAASFNEIAKTNIDALRKHKGNLTHYPESEIRYLVSEFDPAKVDELFLYPQLLNAGWPALEQEIESTGAMPISLVPFFWQTGPMFYHAVRKSKMPAVVLPPRNLPLAKQVMREADIRGIVAEPGIAREFAALLKNEPDFKPAWWHIIVPVGIPADFTPENGETRFLEAQLAPGIGIGYQCAALARANSPLLHPSREYYWEIENGRGHITSMEKHALPLIRLELSAKITLKEQCVCGEPALEFA